VKTITIEADDGTEYQVPTVWEICDVCRGEGKHSRGIEHDGGGITASEWEEMCWGDPDFPDDYMRGRYDQPCDECHGTGKVRVPDEDWINHPETPEAVRGAWYDHCRGEAEAAQERAWERRNRVLGIQY
jgi:hypothetical protein